MTVLLKHRRIVFWNWEALSTLRYLLQQELFDILREGWCDQIQQAK